MYWARSRSPLLPAIVHWWWTRSVARPRSLGRPPGTASGDHAARLIRHRLMHRHDHPRGGMAGGLDSSACSSSRSPPARIARGGRCSARRGRSGAISRGAARFHAGMFGLWWFVALAPTLIAQASPAWTWWLTATLARDRAGVASLERPHPALAVACVPLSIGPTSTRTFNAFFGRTRTDAALVACRFRGRPARQRVRDDHARAARCAVSRFIARPVAARADHRDSRPRGCASRAVPPPHGYSASTSR